MQSPCDWLVNLFNSTLLLFSEIFELIFLTYQSHNKQKVSKGTLNSI